MATFTVLTSASGTLIVDRAPVVVDRFLDRGKRVHVVESVTAKRFVIETASSDDSRLMIRFTKLTAAQAETLAVICDGGGVITAKMKYGGSTFSVAYGGVLTAEPIIGDYPDGDRVDGSALPALVTPWRALVVLYKL